MNFKEISSYYLSGIFEYYTPFIYMIVYFTVCLILNVSTADVAL